MKSLPARGVKPTLMALVDGGDRKREGIVAHNVEQSISNLCSKLVSLEMQQTNKRIIEIMAGKA